MLTVDGKKSKSQKRAKVRFLLATLTHNIYGSCFAIIVSFH